MVIFVNDIPVRIRKPDEAPDANQFTYTIDLANESLSPAKLVHHVWVKGTTQADLEALFAHLNSPVPLNILSLDISLPDYEIAKEFLNSKFKVVKAAGGLVRKKEKFLMIYRLKKWDLPKGKKESKERYRETAKREVEEECNIDAKVGRKICTTWHTYTMNKRSMLKKTRWYVMDVTDDSKMRPQEDEDIEDLRWMTAKEVYHALEHSYRSIRYVFESYYNSSQ